MIQSNNYSKNSLNIYDNISGKFRSLNSRDLLGDISRTSFGELGVKEKHITLEIKPNHGVSQLSDETGINFNATIIENSGRIELQTANQTGSNSYISSVVKGVAKHGHECEAVLNVKIINSPTGNQYSRWGYYDGENGIGFGNDQSGLYVFRLDNSAYSKVYRNNWNVNQLSGAGNLYSFDETQAAYNYSVGLGGGNILYFIDPLNTTNNKREKVLCHTLDDRTPIIDPNQSLRAEINNLQSVGQAKISVGNRCFGIFGGDVLAQKKPLADSVSDYTLVAAQNVWEPIISIRKKTTFGPSSRNNSVNVSLHGFFAQTDQNAEFMITLNGNVTGTNWLNPEFRDSNESACEVQKITTNNLGVAKTGQAISKFSLLASNKHDTHTEAQEISYFGNGGELIVFARRTTASATKISAQIHWDEEY